jgi:DNA-binding transcriptional LysR family regulator
MDRLQSMEIFVAVVDLGSFTAAANAFRISPPMVSKHISAREKRLGATLLKRTTRSLHPTEIGQTYYESCKKILGEIELAESGATAMSATPKGLLRVSASTWYGSLTLAPLVCDYLGQHPEVNVDLSLTDRFVDIVDEGIDVAIRIGELADSSLIARKLSLFALSICASPDYLRQAGTPRKPGDLPRHQCLGFTNWRTQSGWQLLQKQIGAGQMPRFQSNNGQALRTAALKGLGIIMMPRDLLRQDIEQGTLVEIMRDHVAPPRPIHAVYPRERQSVPKLTSFVDFLVEQLR